MLRVIFDFTEKQSNDRPLYFTSKNAVRARAARFLHYRAPRAENNRDTDRDLQI
jgi:hypothetical protein